MKSFLSLRTTLVQTAFSSLATLVFAASTLVHGQSVVYSGTSPALNFGRVNVCPAGATKPTPCSKTLTLTYRVTAGGTLGTPKAVTEGASNLDYNLASGSTCRGVVTGGTTCSVNVTLAPRYSGLREGAAQIVDESGKILATTLIYGIGVAPQIAFDPATQTTVSEIPGGSQSVAVDELGNAYVGQEYGPITKVPPGGGPATSLGTGLSFTSAVALDGAGNLFVADQVTGTNFIEIPVDGGDQITLPFTGVVEGYGLAVDGAGDVFLSCFSCGVGIDSAVIELPSGSAQISTLPFTGLYFPGALTVDSLGDIFVSNGTTTSSDIVELPASATTSITLPITGTGDLAVDAAGDLFAGGYHQIVQIPAGTDTPIVLSGFSESQGLAAVSSAGDVFSTIPSAIISKDYLVELHRSQPPSVTFPETALGSTSIPLSVQIQNIGNAALSLSGISASASFAVVPSSGTLANCTTSSSLAPGARCNLSITFTPKEVGLETGALTLSDNSLNNTQAKQIIQLAGTIGDAPRAKLSATTMQFGHIAYPNGKTLPLKITNIGGQTLTVSPSINGPSYKIKSSTCGTGVAPGESCTLQVQYVPVAVGYHSDILSLATNGSINYGPTTLSVSLGALSTGVGVLENQNTLDFGDLDLDNTPSEVLPLTIYNYGVPGKVMVGATINGPSYTIIGSTCSGGVAAGQSCTLQVQFLPVSQGEHIDILTLNPSGCAATTTVKLRGSGEYPGG